jgi:ligand-binding sensor domain-containing protein
MRVPSTATAFALLFVLVSALVSLRAGAESAGPPDPWSGDVSALATGRGRLFIGSFDQGLFVSWDGRSPRLEKRVNPNVNALAWDEHSGSLWVGTARGLSRCALGRDDSLDCRRVGQSVAVHALLVARDGTLVAGTERGLAFYGGERDPASVREFGAKERAPFRAVWALAESDEGELFIGTTSGLHWAKTNAFRSIAGGKTPRLGRAAFVSGELRDDWVTALCVAGDALYVGTYNAGLSAFRIGPRGLTWDAGDEALGYVNPAGLTHLNDGRLAVATMDGLRVGTPGNFEAVPTLGRDVTAVVSTDPTGTYFVASRRGVERKRLVDPTR